MNVIYKENLATKYTLEDYKKIEEYSAYATLRVAREKHKDVLIPFVKSFILDVNLEEKKIIVKYIKGLL